MYQYFCSKCFVFISVSQIICEYEVLVEDPCSLCVQIHTVKTKNLERGHHAVPWHRHFVKSSKYIKLFKIKAFRLDASERGTNWTSDITLVFAISLVSFCLCQCFCDKHEPKACLTICVRFHDLSHKSEKTGEMKTAVFQTYFFIMYNKFWIEYWNLRCFDMTST